MEITKATAALVAGLCLALGAGGAYLATRGSSAPAAVTSPVGESVSPDPLAGAAVEQSEAIVAEPAQPAAPELAAPSPPRAAAPRTQRAPARRPAAEPAAPAPAASPVAGREEPPAALAPALEPIRPVEPEIVRAPEPQAPQFEDLVIAADSVIGLQVDTALSSERARVEDQVVAHVTRDVRVGDRVAIPSGARAVGEVTLVERGGRLKERARLGIRFTSIVLADGTRVPIESDTIFREGDAPGGESAAKIGGGAIGGAIIGGILGGAKGAIIGGSAGAGAGTAAVLAGGRNPATLPAGTPVTVRILKPATVTVEQ
jgi:type IV secretory pathway VirB10-like protein